MVRETYPIESARDDHIDGTTFNHPAFGAITVSRRMGGSKTLYGSDCVHNTTVCIMIAESEETRSLSNDWYYGKKNLIELEMTEAQWATFVSSFSVGSGVPCTLTRKVVDGKYTMVDEIKRHPKNDVFKREHRETLGDAISAIEAMENQLRNIIDGKEKLNKGVAKELLGKASRVHMNIDSNIDFVADSFEEDIEKRVEQGKIDLHAHFSNMIKVSGLEALKNSASPVLLEQKQK